MDTTVYSRLREIGDWLKINGEAIYATRPCKRFAEGKSIRFTQSKDGKTVYVFLFDLPEKPVKLSNIQVSSEATFQLLGSDEKLQWKKTAAGREVSIPDRLPNGTKHVWVLKTVLP